MRYANNFYLAKCETLQNRKAEVDLRRYWRHVAAIFENLHDVIADRPTRIKFGKSMQNQNADSDEKRKSKQVVEFHYGVVLWKQNA